jgi:hypothetical protein
VIFLAARVVTNPALPALPESWGPWAAALAARLEWLPSSRLFILLLAMALLLQVIASSTRYPTASLWAISRHAARPG